jgi:hypothetical protein
MRKAEKIVFHDKPPNSGALMLAAIPLMLFAPFGAHRPFAVAAFFLREGRRLLPLGQIQPVPSLAIFHLDDPYVRVERDLARQSLFDGGWLDPFILMGARPEALGAMRGEFRLRGGRVERGAAIEAVDDDEDGAGFRRAAPSQHRRRAFDGAAPEIGRDPDVGPHAHRGQRVSAATAALSCLTSLAVTSPAGVRPCARSNISIAFVVAALATPSALTT